MKREIITIDEEKCDGCGVCIPACAEGALQIVDGKARLVKESYCDGLGACLNECPQGAITIEEREADAFNEEEVKVHLKSKSEVVDSMPCGCPSATEQSWEAQGDKKAPSLLTHWPVKLRLVTANAPYFRGEELVVAADCGPFSYGSFHQDFLDERAVVIGCPKFDDLEFYQEKLTEILQNSGIKKVIVVRMEVPCCSGWLTVVRNAVSASGREIAIEEKVIGIQGKLMASEGDK
ncbi:MAG: 4Fe-4S binding protein [Deltaproteobacteria bacterium]|nr:4Fe-4S binding protein [Deltaproteobacteria bacterium]